MGAIRDRIVAAAREELRKQSLAAGPRGPISQDPKKRYKEGTTDVRGGWERLRDIFQDAVQGFNSPNDKSFRDPLGALPMNRNWCGIFGAYVMRRANVSAQWTLVNGTMFGSDIRLLKIFTRTDTKAIPVSYRTAENLYVEPGDVITIESVNNHHCVIVGVDADRKAFDTIEGNVTFQEIRAGRQPASKVTAVYKVVTDTKFPTAALETPPGSLPSTVASAIPGAWKVTVGGKTYHYVFSSPSTVKWGATSAANEGVGSWYASGGGYMKIAWNSGSIELWDFSRGVPAQGVTGKYYYRGDPAATISAKRA